MTSPISAQIAASKRTAARVALVLAAVGSAAQIAGYTIGVGDALGFSILMYSGVVVAAAGVIVASAAIVGEGPRVVAIVAILIAVAPVVVLLVSTALTPTPEY